MNVKRFLILCILMALLIFSVWLPANAAPNLQQQVGTPTPGADGRIIYIVQPGDTCTRVSLLTGISVDQLRQLNSKLDENCTLVEGQELLIGLVAPATETPTPIIEFGTPTATPTPLSGTTEVCVLLFNDVNGNAIREETEPAVADGAVSVTEINGAYSGSQTTVIPSDPEAFQGICFTDVPEGTYNITVAIPDNYNPTTELNASLKVNAGDIAIVPFGIQSRDVVVDPNENQETPGDGGQNTILGIVGGLLLLGGVGLGYYAWRTSRPESKLSGGGYLRK
ncbi:MAG: LysM peptidoglycan-binding domain-containing protein [Anaerolineales bacterium]|nr:LysM peptidoglycan-binding domain-containing protein [Anaerolineales bacterium]